MRKIVLTLNLCLLLLTAQLGAFAHELSHLPSVSRQDVRADGPTSTQTICALCLAYSQLGNPAVHSFNTTRFEPTSCAASAALCPADLPADVPTARSRGPPV